MTTTDPAFPQTVTLTAEFDGTVELDVRVDRVTVEGRCGQHTAVRTIDRIPDDGYRFTSSTNGRLMFPTLEEATEAASQELRAHLRSLAAWEAVVAAFDAEFQGPPP